MSYENCVQKVKIKPCFPNRMAVDVKCYDLNKLVSMSTFNKNATHKDTSEGAQSSAWQFAYFPKSNPQI